MKKALFASMSAALSLAAILPVCADEVPPLKSYAIPSWGDYTVVYGPGTDPAMSSPEEMEAMMRFWKARGYSGVFLRSDLQQFEPYVLRNPKEQMNAALALLWQSIDKQSEGFDYYRAAQEAAEATGMEFWAYHPHLFSQGAPVDVGVEGWGRMIPWSYVSKLQAEHPEVVSVDRKGNKYWMVPEYGYAVARKAQADEFAYMAKKYGLKHFIASLRSEVNQLIDPADKADRFGFNQVVVDDMKRLHNVDIMTDPRFDVDSPNFDPRDPMVENWHNLRGEYFTQTLREIRKALDEVDPKIELAIQLSGDRVGPPMGNWRMDWRKWVDEGIVDVILAPYFFEATPDPDVPKKGYLTSVIHGVGLVDGAEIKDYIKKSAHPNIRLISTGGPPYFYEEPKAGFDGWQRDVWYSSYHVAWNQRWKQYMRDVNDWGYIKFLEQNFDDLASSEIIPKPGAWGLLAYNPKIRACPGGWWRLGTGENARPFAQAAVKRGARGQAIEMTSTPDNSGTLTSWHMSSPDRSHYTGAVDTSITNGMTDFSFWLMRKNAESGAAAYIQNDGSELDIGVNVAPKTGVISYSTGREGGTGKWVATNQTLPVGQWQKFTLRIDLDKHQYALLVGDANPVTAAQGVAFEIPKERVVEIHGYADKIPVPAYREFQKVYFVPGGAEGSKTYLDDVSVRWTPTLHYATHGPKTEFAENYEKTSSKLIYKIADSAPQTDSASGSGKLGGIVTNEVSFGDGVKSLYLAAGNKATPMSARRLNLGAPMTIDFDVFIRSDIDYPYILPNFTTQSAHRATVGLVRANGTGVAGIMAGAGTWHYWNGNAYVDSGARINYDVWSHVQLAFDGQGNYRVIVQPEGQVPFQIASGKASSTAQNENLALNIDTSGKHFSAYDNFVVTSGKPAAGRVAAGNSLR